ncbi:hypothetical protein Y032_0095g2822 [Ancylostoma ceylanicum]|uniref:Glycosyl hydrolase family 25 n=1 Tax=Ancylostoma ceylanicum TaxID=53326 RepID=A0A016TKM9_9BILA|nr:hypothetical protein Y032_0095g2822 [Ancylostoma ceylanicum]
MLLTAGLCLILAIGVDAQAQTLYALDLTEPLSESDALCMKMSQYSAVFLRAYAPSLIDGFEEHVCQSIWNAQKGLHLLTKNYPTTPTTPMENTPFLAGLGVEVFMTPTRPSYENGADQFNRLYQGLQGCKITAKSVWLQVISPAEWGFSSSQASIDFINQVLRQASSYGVAAGIYTSQGEWTRITSGVEMLASPTRLWYWNVNDPGPMGATPANFSDFHAFGPWTSPTVKQFGQEIRVCGHTANTYVISTTLSKMLSIAYTYIQETTL